MMKRLCIFAIAILTSVGVRAQVTNTRVGGVFTVTALPGTCALGQIRVLTTDNLLYVCGPANTWTASNVGGAPGYPLLATNGTAGAPSYSFTNSPTTGLYRFGADALGISNAGAASWVFNASGAFVAASDGGVDIGNGASDPRDVNLKRNVVFRGQAFAALGTPANGTVTYCTDCTTAAPTAGGGTGAFVKREAGAWNASSAGVPTTRTISTTSPLGGGGDLSADRTFTCTTCGVTGTGLGQFASTTSAQLATVLSDETGSGFAVFGTNPTITSLIPTFTDVTTGDVSTLQHGLVPKATGSTTTFLNGNGAYTTPVGTGATKALDDLASVAINTALLPSSAAASDFGSATLPWKDLWLAGSSGTPGTNNYKVTGTATAARVVTFPDASTTVPVATQVITFAGPTAARTYTFPDAADTVSTLASTQTISGNKTLDCGTSCNSFFTYSTNTTIRGYTGTGGVAGGIITGSAVGDMNIRAEATALNFSTNSGTGRAFWIAANNGSLNIGTNINMIGNGGYIDLGTGASAIFYQGDVGTKRLAAGVKCDVNGSGTCGAGWTQFSGDTAVTTQFDKTSDTALAAITMSASPSLIAGRSYGFEAELHITAGTVGGEVVDMGGGTATATTFIDEVKVMANTTNTFAETSRQTSLTGASAGIAGDTSYEINIKGWIKVNAGGTFLPRIAQKTSNGTSTSVLVGSTMRVWDSR